MKLRIYSDIHNEFRKYEVKPRTGRENSLYPYHFDIIPKDDDKDTVLVLAGDIDSNPYSLEEFLKAMARRFRHVVYVAGNHEYYDYPMSQVDGILKNLSNTTRNITVFDEDYDEPLMIDDVMFVGDTLWTDLQNCNPVAMQAVKRGMHDFRYIALKGLSEVGIRELWDKVITTDGEEQAYFRAMYDEAMQELRDNAWTPTLMAAAHADAKRKILRQLSKKEELKPRKVVMVSHHVPHFVAQSRYTKGACHGTGIVDYGYYCTDMDDVLEHVDVVIHGHTHDVGEFTWNGIRFIANAVGYAGHEHTEYTDEVFEV